jgi:CubicO group peptidase (beta-lactamase class C family)
MRCITACLAGVAGVAMALATRGAAAQTPAPDDTLAVDSIVRAQVDSGFSGVVLVARGDSVILHRAYSTGRVALAPTSAFHIASMTKGFTAAAILRLQEQGKLTVRDSIARFFPDAPADRRDVTLHQLLTHTAGFARAWAGADIADRDSAARAILARPLDRAPGTGFGYVDDDYELLAAIVEVASGTTWESYVERELLRPAGLTRTGFWCRPRTTVPAPVAAADGKRTECPVPKPGVRAGDWGHRGANGMSSTAADLLRWTRALGEGRGEGRVLSDSSRAALYAPQVFVRREPDADVSYGYGVRVYTKDDRTTELLHAGAGDDGHTTVARVQPSGLTVIVLSNAGMHGETTWASYVAQRLVVR